MCLIEIVTLSIFLSVSVCSNLLLDDCLVTWLDFLFYFIMLLVTVVSPLYYMSLINLKVCKLTPECNSFLIVHVIRFFV